MSFYYEDMHLTITDNNGNNSLINFNNIIEDDISPEMGARFQVLSDEIVAKNILFFTISVLF
ncbi:Hypothetical protein CINCED_3A005647 [Cinara cedri]|uniref:Uncharacterized protein n=1 Tax=Cinara cedri TaxID=506608 RepID=A0A5E4NGI8_9HEMI|nr:Hypothetical protein CINCED_3A005647 [Cinara cedri]